MIARADGDVYSTGRTSLDYHAVQDTGRRQAPRTVAHHEDRILNPKARKRMEETATDQNRNYSIIAWAVRLHLDYVSQFNPNPSTGSRAVDKEIKRRLKEGGKRRNFDVSKRHNRSQAMRMFELSKILEGDAAFLNVGGGRWQLIEGRMIGKPKAAPKKGVRGLTKRRFEAMKDSGFINDPITGEILFAAINRFSDNGRDKEYAALVSAANLIFDAYYPRENSSRGVSPLSTAINQATDVYENFEFTLLKIKLHTLLGVAITRDGGDDDGFSGGEDEDEDDEQYTSGVAPEIQLGNGVVQLGLDPGEDVKTIESQTPSDQFVDFSRMMIRIILLALDIPFTLFDSMQSSFSARIADINQYERSTRWKIEKNIEVLEEMTEADVSRWLQDKEFTDLLKSEEISPIGLNEAISWIPVGVPWFDKLKEVKGDETAIAIGTDSTPRACRRRGTDAYEIADEQAAFNDYCKGIGVQHTIGQPGQETVQEKEEKVDA